MPSISGIYRALVRHHLIEPKAKRKRFPTYKRWERGRPMEDWQMDVVGGVLLDDGTECKVLTGIDDHSRFCVCAGVMVRATARAVCGFFAQALERHGVPEEILTDNGKTHPKAQGEPCLVGRLLQVAVPASALRARRTEEGTHSWPPPNWSASVVTLA